MQCRAEERDPRKCLNEGREVTECGLSFIQDVKKTCRDEAEAFARCVEWNSQDLQFEFCRREEKIFDACMDKKMKAVKPPFGYFSQVRIHDSKRQPPLPRVAEFPDKSIGLPKDYEELKNPPHRHGSRWFFFP